MPQPTLDERFASGPPSREPEQRRTWLNADERRFILWAMKEKWAAARIARSLGTSEPTIRRFRRKFMDEPQLLLELGLFEMLGKVKDEEHRCLVCSERMVGRERVERHTLLHYVDRRIVNGFLGRRGRPD